MATQVARVKEIRHTYVDHVRERIKDVQDHILGANCSLDSEDLQFLGMRPEEYVSMKELTFKTRLQQALAHTKLNAKSWVNIISALGNLLENFRIASDYFKKKDKVIDGDLNNVVKILTPSVVGAPQLTAIRATTAAENGHIPEYVAKGQKREGRTAEVNFSHDDQTILRVYIAVQYPFAGEEEVRDFIKTVIAGRKSKPWGYDGTDAALMHLQLTAMNARGAAALLTPKISGSGKTQLMTQ
jgi:hypothetical protein